MSRTYRIEPVPGRMEYHSRARASLLFISGEALYARALCEGQTLVVGRAAPADLVLESRSLSRLHARFTLRDGEVSVEDLDSTNGLLLNGDRVSTALLTEGDVALLGTVEVRVSAAPSSRSEHWISHAAFLAQLDQELTRARLFGREATVIALSHEPGAQELGTEALAHTPLIWLCRYGPRLTLVLLSERGGESAAALCRAHLFAHANPRVGLASYPAITCGPEQLVSRAIDACHAAEAGGIRQAEVETKRSEKLVRAPRSASMRQLYELAARAARTDMTLLVQGETGTGKELVARYVHEESTRRAGPFKALNCATIPSNLLESMLFGHERGAFSGADRAVPGIFEQAERGTVFLDEVGELSLQAQAALLRVVEQRVLVRVGGVREQAIDVRIVAATHRNLAAMVRADRFREDLLFRLDALSLRVPPLRDRSEEIVPLAELFLSQAQERWKLGARRLSEGVCDLLQFYSWPGNVRQLKNVIERAAVVCAVETIQIEHLPDQVLATDEAVGETAPAEQPQCTSGSLPNRLRDFETSIIREALARAHGNQAQAARILGIPRRTLTHKVHAYGLLETS